MVKNSLKNRQNGVKLQYYQDENSREHINSSRRSHKGDTLNSVRTFGGKQSFRNENIIEANGLFTDRANSKSDNLANINHQNLQNMVKLSSKISDSTDLHDLVYLARSKSKNRPQEGKPGR